MSGPLQLQRAVAALLVALPLACTAGPDALAPSSPGQPLSPAIEAASRTTPGQNQSGARPRSFDQRAPAALPDFMLGSFVGKGSDAAWLNELGMRWARTVISWSALEPSILDPLLTVADVEADPSLVDTYLESRDWSGYDRYLGELEAAGLGVVGEVGLAWIGLLPTIDGETATPDRLGRDEYLGNVYRHVRAVVERYDGDGYLDADGVVIRHWQIENELNQAMLTAVWGWREPVGAAGFTSLWADWDFLTELLFTLNRAVHYSDPGALTIQNLHTDIPQEYNHFFRLPGWIDAAHLWRDSMDVLGFDAYPNYYYADPIHGEVVGERAALLLDIAAGKPVMVMEVGYPSGPTEMGYTPEKQATFVQEAFNAVYAAGASGYFHFKLESTDTHTVEISDEDKATVKAVGRLFEKGRVLVLVGWALRNLDYVLDQLIDVLQAVEGYWGLVTTGGDRKPSFYAMQTISAALYGDGAAMGVADPPGLTQYEHATRR